jgi:hypothetical protein
VVVQPLGLMNDLLHSLQAMPDRKSVVVIPLLFSAFVAMAYVTLHAMTQNSSVGLHAFNRSPNNARIS